jgi:hypothetical protein
MHDSAFLLLAGTLIHKQNPLALLHSGGQRKGSSVSTHGKHVGEFVEGFRECVLAKNMHRDGQYEPLASSGLPARPNFCVHTT